jgi:hypothetical protein
VQAVLARFPGAEIVDVRKGEMPAVPQEAAGEGSEPAFDDSHVALDDDERPAADADDDL